MHIVASDIEQVDGLPYRVMTITAGDIATLPGGCYGLLGGNSKRMDLVLCLTPNPKPEHVSKCVRAAQRAARRRSNRSRSA